MELLRDPDADLVAALRRPENEGFEQAFEALYLKYRDRVYSVAFRICGSAADAMDALQEAFSLVFRKLHLFRADSLFSTWLFRIVVNCSIDLRRKGRRLVDAPGLVEEPQDDSAGPLASAESSEFSDQMQQAIGMLSPKLRAILALRYLEDMTYEELAATLDLSMGTVKSRLARAHLALERVLLTSFPHLVGEGADGAARAEGGIA
ncbi:MAG: RNA polymerase sigma factor RpoE [Planctomycetota bacterium]